ncbi:uncharacterized protein [Euphorbia lathyris]|uniref:uncharacterized protein n=1 Tax=Euphorbia lathyris TaxID=212925 RepID=UPI003313F457
MDLDLNHLLLAEDEETPFEFLANREEDSGGTESLVLIGRFLTERVINFTSMKTRMADIWMPKKGVWITAVNANLFSFKFYHKIDKERVEEGGPWSFDGKLVLGECGIGQKPEQVELSMLPIWVQVYGIPVGFFSEAVGRQIGEFIGGFVQYDGNNDMSSRRMEYMRIRVRVDVRSPLKRCKRIKRSVFEFSFLQFKYERLCNFCFLCGVLGHTERFCDNLFIEDTRGLKREWGIWLVAQARRGGAGQTSRWLREPNLKDEEDWKVGQNTESTNLSGINMGKGKEIVINSEREVAGREDEELVLVEIKKRRRAEARLNNEDIEVEGMDTSSGEGITGVTGVSLNKEDSTVTDVLFLARPEAQVRQHK